MSDPYNSRSSDSVLGPTLKFKGELSAEEDLLILGSVEGSIHHTAQLTIGEEGSIKADIQAERITVDGTVVGNLTATSSVCVRDGADVKGDIYAPTVSLYEGCRFKGKIDMDVRKAQSERSKPEPKQAKTAAA